MRYVLSILILMPLFGSAQLSKLVDDFEKLHPEAHLGVYVIDRMRNEVLFAHNENKNLTPASSLKTLVTGAALDILGTDFQFQTRFGIRGTVENHVLKGDLIIFPDADPTLGSAHFGEAYREGLFTGLIEAFKVRGIESMTGKVIVNTQHFSEEKVPPKWIWEDVGNYFGPVIAPLNIYDNQVSLFLNSPDAKGSVCQLSRMQPQVPGLEFEVLTVADDIRYDDAWVFGGPDQYKRQVRGAIPKGRKDFEVKASMPDPMLFAAQQVVKELREAGIDVPPAAVSISDEPVEKSQVEEIYVHTSPRMDEIVRITNMESSNLYAEALLMRIGYELTGICSREKGIDRLKNFYGILNSANLYDGSGLSRYNGISVKELVEVSAKHMNAPYAEAYLRSLPLAGRSGSISAMFKGTKAEGVLRAKSGYMDKVRSYSGVINDPRGRPVCFAIVVNQYWVSAGDIRDQVEAMMVEIAEMAYKF